MATPRSSQYLLSTRDSRRESWFDLPSSDSSIYPLGARTSLISLSAEYSLSHNPYNWGWDLSPDNIEDDDDIHAPTKRSRYRSWVSRRGLENYGCLLLIILALLVLNIGYPVLNFIQTRHIDNRGARNVERTNDTGQIPDIGNFRLIDRDTPPDVYNIPSWADSSKTMQLVFSDEFNVDGRTFYPGDDPYWEAVDLHYWQTNNIEWYDPEAITTANGSLVITLSQKATHDLNYQGGMMSTWNKFCFTGGYFEAKVQLPGLNNILGLWPAVWSMGNLGRAGYGASLEGTWPYTYDTCDVGTVANQSINGLPVAATVNGDPWKGGVLSYLPGQRLSRCTCDGENHPGPKHPDGTFVGRAAPEIDLFEAQINEHTLLGQVSQSGQWAPFNHGYTWDNSSANLIIPDPTTSSLNVFVGSATQQATSVVTFTDPNCYEYDRGCFQVYGFEYKPGFDEGYITWISSGKVAWTLRGHGMGPDPLVEIGARPVPQEPMYLIMNLGMSSNFGPIDFENLPFPVHMRVDYVRVYQPEGAINIGCDPPDFPTAAYINQHIEAYTNPNLTTWVHDYQQPWPKNSFLGQC